MAKGAARLRGVEAIEYAEARGLTLGKYADPTEDAREGLTVSEAREVAREDPSLIYVDHIREGGCMPADAPPPLAPLAPPAGHPPAWRLKTAPRGSVLRDRNGRDIAFILSPGSEPDPETERVARFILMAPRMALALEDIAAACVGPVTPDVAASIRDRVEGLRRELHHGVLDSFGVMPDGGGW